MNPKIIVVGSANTDMVVKVHHLPEPGETILGGDYSQFQGGKGANQAVAAARLGADVTLIARLGQDALGEASVAAYRAEGIHTDFIVRDDAAPSGVALIMVNHSGENVIAVASGANARLSPADILAAEKAIQDADCLLVQLEIPLDTVQEAARLAAKHHVPVILNPAPAVQLPAELLEMVDYLTPNQTEAAILTGVSSVENADAAANVLQSRFKVKNIVITLGKNGAQIASSRTEWIAPYSVHPVDTTGAGDAFNGGLAVALARGDALPDAVKFANAVAGISTTRVGAQPSMPTLAEVLAFIQTNS